MRLRFMRPIPHAAWQDFPGDVNRERTAGQLLLALRNGETLPGFMLRDLEQVLKPGSPGSANWLWLDVATCYRHDWRGYRQAVVEMFQSELAPRDARSGWMAPLADPKAERGRNELGSKGNHGAGGWHAFARGAIYEHAITLGDAEVAALCVRWFRMFAYFNLLQRVNDADGTVVGPAVRDGEPSDLTNVSLSLVLGDSARVPPAGARVWRIASQHGDATAKGGVPYGIGPMMLRELLRDGLLAPFDGQAGGVPQAVLDLLRAGGLADPFAPPGPADLVPVATPTHIVMTSLGHVAWMVGAEVGPGNEPFTPIAYAWFDGAHTFSAKRKAYQGPIPTEGDPGVPIRGELMTHWRGDWQGWRRMDSAPVTSPPPSPAPPPPQTEKKPWWRIW